MEFEVKDYETARKCASLIKNNADNILNVFNDIDRTMNELYGGSWDSSGSENAKERYDFIRKNYELFYNSVIAMQSHINQVTNRNIETDNNISEALKGV